jgi:hypothetical protein
MVKPQAERLFNPVTTTRFDSNGCPVEDTKLDCFGNPIVIDTSKRVRDRDLPVQFSPPPRWVQFITNDSIETLDAKRHKANLERRIGKKIRRLKTLVSNESTPPKQRAAANKMLTEVKAYTESQAPWPPDPFRIGDILGLSTKPSRKTPSS